MIDYKADDKSLCASDFIQFVNCVWPGRYDPDKTQAALSKTLNITACDGRRLVGCLRILTDGCFFGTITEILVLPEYQGRGCLLYTSCRRRGHIRRAESSGDK